MTEKLDQRSPFKRIADMVEWAFYYATGKSDLAFAKGVDMQAHKLGKHSGVAFSEIRKEMLEARTKGRPQYPYDLEIEPEQNPTTFELDEIEPVVSSDPEIISIFEDPKGTDSKIGIDASDEILPFDPDPRGQLNNIPTRRNDEVIILDRSTPAPEIGPAGR